MPHYPTTFGNNYNFQGRGVFLEQTDTLEFAETISGNSETPAEQPPAKTGATKAPTAPLTGDSFFYADPQPGEGPDTPSTEMGDDFVI